MTNQTADQSQTADPSVPVQVLNEAVQAVVDTCRIQMELVLEVDPSELSEDERRDVVDRVQAIITNRVDQFGVSEPIIHREGDWRIVVELPGIQDVERAQALIGRTARLEFKILEPPEERVKVLDRIEEVRQVWQVFRDRRPETYDPITKV